MPLKYINPSGIAAPFSNYSHAVKVDPGMHTLFVSGQLGLDENGVFAEGFRAQFERAMKNLLAVLKEAEMSAGDIVKLTVLSCVREKEAIAGYREIRDQMMTGHAPAALFAMVDGFTHSDILVEVEAIAAR